MSAPGEARERKRGWDNVEPSDRDAELTTSKKHKCSESGSGDTELIAMKLLFSRSEANVIQGQNNITAQLLEGLTGTTVKCSGEDELYPGTDMREVNIQGPSLETVLNAATLALSQVSGGTGLFSGGETGAEASNTCIRLVIPAKAAKAFDGPEHKALDKLDELQSSIGVKWRVLPTLVPPGEPTELSEQIICLSGSVKGVQSALSVVAEPVVSLASEGWFKRWANNSNCGLKMPGVTLLVDGQGSTRSSTRVSRWDEGSKDAGGNTPGTDNATSPNSENAIARASLSTTPAGMGMSADGNLAGMGMSADGNLAAMGIDMNISGPMLLKLLISIDEASVLRSRGGALLTEIRHATGAEFLMSHNDEVYPGTFLQQVVIQGPTAEATVAAAVEMYNKIIEVLGTVSGGLAGVETGGARLKIIVPSRATAAVIGPGGQVVSQLRAQTQMHVHVEATPVPPGPLTELSEQVVSFDGPLAGIPAALMLMTGLLTQFAMEAWFPMWAASSNSGAVFQGFSLFQDTKGAGKCKGKGKVGKDGACVGGSSAGLTLKLLVPANEASCVLGKGGASVREIGQVTGTRVSLSARNEFYPGTQLQELKIQGASQDSVLTAAAHTLSKIAELTGAVSGGEVNVEPGGCRLKVVVPFMAAAAIIGPRGVTVKQVRERSGMHVHIEEATVPPGPPTEISEQVVSLSGPLQGSYMALSMIAEVLVQLSSEVWFEAWASHSNCGVPTPGLVLFGDGGKGAKAQGKGKGKLKGFKGEDMGYEVNPAEFSKIPAGVLAAMQNNTDGMGLDHNSGPTGMMGGDFMASGFQAGGSTASTMALKVLMSVDEVGVLGHDPATMMQIQQATSTIGMLSDKAYPGTNLQELTIQGPAAEAVFSAVLLILNKVGEVMGAVSSGEPNVPLGDARVKLVVPKRAASAIIGPGGQKVKQIRAQSGIRVSVDPNSIPCSDKIAEQAVCLAGPLNGMQVALGLVVTEVANFAAEPWFQPWAAHSNTGQVIPGLALFMTHREQM